MQININNQIPFKAKLSGNLKTYLLKDDFGGDVKRLNQFEKLFNDTFDKSLDENTVVDIAPNGRFKLYNSIAPNITFPIKIYSHAKKSLSQRILTECYKVYSTAEYRLFERIVSRKYNAGKSLGQISEMANKLNDERRPYFTDMIETAHRILKENPKSKLTELEFLKMRDIQLRELIESEEFQKAMADNDFMGATKLLWK